jgi:hypothetical protein
MRLLLTCLVFFSHLASAECYVVGDLKGYSTRAHEGYQISEDGISSGKFILELNGKSSSITPNNMKCDQVGSTTLLCQDIRADGETTIETWAVHPSAGKVLFTKSITGYGAFNGGNLFVGEIKGTCD